MKTEIVIETTKTDMKVGVVEESHWALGGASEFH